MSKVNESLTRSISSDIGYAILTYFDDYDKTYKCLDNCGFTNIIVKKKRKKIIIDLTMKNPGRFIGEKGNMINFIKDYLTNNNYEKEIIINLKETTSWYQALYPMSLEEVDDIMGYK